MHVAEAVASATDRDVARIEDAFQKAGIVGATVGKTDPARPQTIVVSGIPPAKLSDARSMLQGNDYSSYDVVTTADGNSTLTMKLAAIRDLETRTLDTSIETIRERIDKLGVTEPVIQKYGLGENQILVELPGIDNAAEVEEVIQSTAKLSIHAVTGGPYDTDQAALQANGGTIPADSMLVRGSGSAGAPEMVWLLKRVSEVEGTDFRDAQPSQDQNGRPNIRFTLTTEAGDRFYKYTEAHTATSATPGSMAIVLDNKVREVAGIQSAIRDSGEITGGFTQQQANDLSLMLRTGALPASISFLETRTVGPTPWCGVDPSGCSCGDRGYVGRHGLHADLLPRGGHQCRSCADPEPGDSARVYGLYGVDIDVAGHRRSDPDDRYGRGLECADL